MTLTKVVEFSAAHRLANPASTERENRDRYGPCSRRHGHDYRLEVTVRGPVDGSGMVMDVAVLEDAMRSAVLELVDHRDLDLEVPALEGLVTSGENLVTTFF